MRSLPLFFCLFSAFGLSAQVHHWETVVHENDEWHYFIGYSAPPDNWNSPWFNEENWSEGHGGFGYGDGDDNTIVPNTIALYIRRDFTIYDLSKIASVVLDLDYDDGFVAYLNGVEIARANLAGEPPGFTTTSISGHEAELYNGGSPARFLWNNSQISDLLQQGNNVLAIQVHNVGISSSDLTVRPFLSVGINDSSFTYQTTPSWFEPPADLQTSTLPLVVINTFGQQIVDEPDILCQFGIIYNGPGELNHFNDTPNEYDGFAKIELRGESSLSFAKKSYAVETSTIDGEDLDAAFLNFPEEEDWVLYGPYSDKTLIRNVLTMHIGREMGGYHSRTRLCEVFINNEYQGVYVLMEKIKRDKNRVDIAKLKSTDTEGEELTGGYLFRIDKGNHPGWQSNYPVVNAPWIPIYFQYRYPDPDSIQPAQANYIQTYVDEFEQAMASSPSFINNQGKHYTDYIDLNAFVDNFIVNELARNIDGYRLSTYFYKDKNSKIVAGPLWDFNLSFGNGDYCNGSSYTGWMYQEYCGNGNPFWWQKMLTDSLFLKTLKCRWTELRQTTLSAGHLLDYIDSLATVLELPAQRNFNRWPILGTYVWPNPWPYPETYEEEIEQIKVWTINRLVWMDGMINPIEVNCEAFITSTSEAANIRSVPLAIHPNPATGSFSVRPDDALLEAGPLMITITDLTGREIFRNIFEQNGTPYLQLELYNNLFSGLYMIKIMPVHSKDLAQFGKLIIAR